MNKIRGRGRVISVFIYIFMLFIIVVFSVLEQRRHGTIFIGGVIIWLIGFVGLIGTMPKAVNPKYFVLINTFAVLAIGIFALIYFNNHKILPLIMMLQWLQCITVIKIQYVNLLVVTQLSTLFCVNYLPKLWKINPIYNHIEFILYCLFIGTGSWIAKNLIKSIEQVYDELEEQKMSMDEVLKLLKEKNIAAQKATKSKSAFLSNMSHEIRTPINSIIGMNEIILRTSNEEETISYASTIKSASQMLLALVNDILDFSKIESGKMELVEVNYDLSSVVNDLYSIFNIKMDEKGLDFVVEIDPDLPIGLIGDSIRLRQIVTNLLTNAWKYTDRGTIFLKVKRCANLSTHTVKIRVSVEDTGIGIAKEDLEKLKEMFVRLNLERNNNVEGTGLGIGIVNGYLELMDSSIQIESEVGVGSKFYFDIIQRVYDDTPVGEFSNASMRSSIEKYKQTFIAPDARLLVVDDNSANLKVFEGLLKGLQCKIDTASSGEKAIKNATEIKYDIIFMDHMMPIMDGVETFHHIRQNCEMNKNTPVFVLTANAVAGAEREYLKEGFSGYLTKPIIPLKLEKTVRDNIDEHLICDIEIAAEASDVDSDIDLSELPRIEGLDWDYGLSHFNDVNLLCEIVKEFTNSIVTSIEELRGYYSSIIETSDEKSLHLFEVKVHSMKSSATMIGLLPLAGTAATLEYAARDGRIALLADVAPYYFAECERYHQMLTDAFFVNEEEKITDWNVDEIVSKLDLLNEHTQSFDIHAMDDVMKEIERYQFGDDCTKLITYLHGFVSNLELEKIAETISKIKEMLTNC